MATKTLRDVDDQTWTRFTSYCRAKGVRTGHELTRILKEFLKDVRL